MYLTQTHQLSLLTVLPLQLLIVTRMLAALVHRVCMQIRRFVGDNRGQDLVEYALIVAFAVGVVAVLTALYSTIKSVLTKANTSLQAASK